MLSHRSTLGRKPAQRTMMLRNLVTSLLLYEEIRTTKARAIAIRPVIDRMIVKAKKNSRIVTFRELESFVTDKNAARKVVDVFIKRFAKRPSGFTRIKPLGLRKGDGAQLVKISLVDSPHSTDTSS
jgi:large subunit ribosomal protein L17